MRGKGMAATVSLKAKGITPAYAGKRHKQSGSHCSYRDHPRVCGEKLSEMFFAFLLIGSPPRMRGKVIDMFQIINAMRITPAYAGKSRAPTAHLYVT